jgi:hypothetical protein
MNLALESLIRTNAIRNLFNLPQSICLANNNSHFMWVKLVDSKEGLIKVSRWNLTQDIWNPSAEFFLEIEEVFDQNKVIPDEFFPLEYMSQPVDCELNNYASPMRRSTYEGFFKNVYNTSVHRNLKRCFLWNFFAEQSDILDKDIRSVCYNSLKYEDYEYFIYHAEHEMELVRDNNYELYKMWLNLKNKLMVREKIAGELVFASMFQTF